MRVSIGRKAAPISGLAEKPQHTVSVWAFFRLPNQIGPVCKKRQTASFEMLTRKAHELMANIHNHDEFKYRMPLFLTSELEQFWLSKHLNHGRYETAFDYTPPSKALDRFWNDSNVDQFFIGDIQP